MWDDGVAIEAPPDERGGNSYAQPNVLCICSLLYTVFRYVSGALEQ